jgi:hypothetical protein
MLGQKEKAVETQNRDIVDLNLNLDLDLSENQEDEQVGESAYRGRAGQARRIREFLAPMVHRTCSVFGVKACTKEHLLIITRVCKRLFGPQVHVVACVERGYRGSGDHAHMMVSRVVEERDHRDRPTLVVNALTEGEEEAVAAACSVYCSAWNAETPSRRKGKISLWLRRIHGLRDTALDEAEERVTSDAENGRIVYRVPYVKAPGAPTERGKLLKTKMVPSGLSHFAASYCLKSMWATRHQTAFVCSVGLQSLISKIKAVEAKNALPEKHLHQGYHSSYNWVTISQVAHKVVEELEDGVPADKVCVYAKYNHVKAQRGGRLLIKDNRYLLVGLELLRRELKHFGGTPKLKRAVNKVCSLYAKPARSVDDDVLIRWAHRQKLVQAAIGKAKEDQRQTDQQVKRDNQRRA